MSSARAPRISVVVPVFNAAEFVIASVSSVLDHTRAEVEVICVDDGSTDASAEILATLAECDSRVILVRLGSNHGASAARNAGIDRAAGAYVFFLDADDFVPPGALDLLLAAATGTHSALAIGKLLWLKSREESPAQLPQDPGGPTVTTDIHQSTYLQSVPGCHCCNLYSRELLEAHRIRYDTDLTYGEDQLFQATAMVWAERVSIIEDVVYVYHHYRGQSLTRRPPGLKNLLDDIEFQRRIARLFSGNALPGASRRLLSSWSYSIRQYWLQIPDVLSREEAVVFFSSFRAMAEEFRIDPWNDSTPEHHRHLLDLIMSERDDEALAFLASAEAHSGMQPAPRQPADFR